MSKKLPARTATKEFRFAPARNDKPIAQAWKVKADGSEIYAIARNAGGTIKISIHESGQIHMRLGARELQLLAPPVPFSGGLWLHGLEIRFLLHADANHPSEKLNSGPKPLLIDTPLDHMLVIHILVGAEGCPLEEVLPHELNPSTVLWRTVLRNGRPAILVNSLLKLDGYNEQALRWVWKEISISFKKEPVGAYSEVWYMPANPFGPNVLLVVPMGRKSMRFPGDRPLTHGAEVVIEAVVNVDSPAASVPITAPNGAKVATISFSGATMSLELKRDTETLCRLGTATLTIDPLSLIPGSAFQARPVTFSCVPSVGNLRPANWDYKVASSFDGQMFFAEIHQLSAGLRRESVVGTAPWISEKDEIMMLIPSETVILKADFSTPSVTAELTGRVRLREI